jgi:hypothetical protein
VERRRAYERLPRLPTSVYCVFGDGDLTPKSLRQIIAGVDGEIDVAENNVVVASHVDVCQM